MKTSAVTKSPTSSRAPRSRGPAAPRRREWRFFLPLTAVVEGHRPDGTKFRERAKLDNISSGGAYFEISRDVAVGSKFDLLIDLPKSATGGRKIQLRLNGKAIRLDKTGRKGSKKGVAVRFGKDFVFIAAAK
jgi:hypothetical protein